MIRILATCAFMILQFASAQATDPASTHKHHMQSNMMPDSGLPHEPGQSAFAAIQEIVAKLEADPATDWSKVDIEALRQHLIDMNNVTLNAQVKTEDTKDGLTFIVTGEGTVRDSIRRMVQGHAATMNGVDGWGFAANELPEGESLIVTPPKTVSIQELRALSFIGVMTRGMHHQTHHWMLATGSNPHP